MVVQIPSKYINFSFGSVCVPAALEADLTKISGLDQRGGEISSPTLPGAGQRGGRVQRVGRAGLPGSIVSQGGAVCHLSDGEFYLTTILLLDDICAEYYQQSDGCHGRITQKTVLGQRRELFAALPIVVYP